MARECMLCLCITSHIVNQQHKTSNELWGKVRPLDGVWNHKPSHIKLTPAQHVAVLWMQLPISVILWHNSYTCAYTAGMDGMYWGQEKAWASLVTESGCQGGTNSNFTRYQQTIWLHPHMHPCTDLVSGICCNWFCRKQAVVWTTSRFETLASLRAHTAVACTVVTQEIPTVNQCTLLFCWGRACIDVVLRNSTARMPKSGDCGWTNIRLVL